MVDVDDLADEHWSSLAARVRNGRLDDVLDDLEAAEERSGVLSAIEERRDELPPDDAGGAENESSRPDEPPTPDDDLPEEIGSEDGDGTVRVLVQNPHVQAQYVAGQSFAGYETKRVRKTPAVERAFREGQLRFVGH